MKTRRVRRRTVEIIAERQHSSISAPAGHVLAWCADCAQMAEWVAPQPGLPGSAPDAGVRAAGFGSRFPGLHLREAADGSILICRNSLDRLKRGF